MYENNKEGRPVGPESGTDKAIDYSAAFMEMWQRIMTYGNNDYEVSALRQLNDQLSAGEITAKEAYRQAQRIFEQKNER